MADPAKRRASYEDLRSVPDHLVAEIIEGVLVTHPRPATPHARAASRIGAELDGPFDRGKGGPGGWLILDEPELHLHGDALVPDLAGWRRERMPEMPHAPAIELPPDWVCEILSPATAKLDRADKLPIYARERVRHAWLVDPLSRTLEVLRLGPDASWTIVSVFAGEAPVRAEPFDAVPLELGALWQR